jgi:ribonuclease HI
MAVIEGLEALKIPGSNVTVYTDSKYVADSVEKGWVFQWESKGFKKKKNPDLWIRFLKIYRKHKVRFKWIKGHANNIENEVCDKLAVNAYQKNSLHEDTGYNPEDDNDKLL